MRAAHILSSMPKRLSTSVAMCTFQGERFLAQQLESIARQTAGPSELVVCDDGSTDGTVAIVESFAGSAPFPIRLTINRQRAGSTKNFEQAISLCQGEVIFLADQDDVWHPEKIATMMRRLSGDQELACLFSDARLIDDDGTTLPHTLWQHIGFRQGEQQFVKEGRAFELLVTRNVATGAAMAFRARDRDLLLPIPEEHVMVHDRWIALLLSVVARVDCMSEPLIDYRQHAQQQRGPGQRVGGVGTWLSAVQVTGPRQFAEWAGQLRLVQQRLTERGVDVRRQRMAGLQERIEHLQNRASMSRHLVRRLTSVTRELMRGRYHRYSNHFWSAAKDLFRAYEE
jgi:glycosyl transferase family 2